MYKVVHGHDFTSSTRHFKFEIMSYLDALCISEHKKKWQRIAVGVERILGVQRRIVDVRLFEPDVTPDEEQ